ncbi:hypothetical protein [Streptacidiphilus jiangxiensis]|uniref:Uncharacterized protein n=1 Tax=Streptacidiphilus jiangxiensis TaxID=235985 RepID=A0A1H8B7K5_STRJI|nr:hypothetical protein [Streptacidiphilus jiangxiensis]SEM78945.1 hypothetical protein SAMN05414137_1595 [Streptacidiphilus jiangxiensis]
MVLLGITITVGWLSAALCLSVAFARELGGRGLDLSTPISGILKLLNATIAFGIGQCLPLLYTALGFVSGTGPRWLALLHGLLVLAAFLLAGRIWPKIRWGMRSDEHLTRLVGEVVPVVVTAQRRAGDQGGELVERMKAALRDGRGRDALRRALQVHALVEDAGLPEHQAWTEVSRQLLHWQKMFLPVRESRARRPRRLSRHSA